MVVRRTKQFQDWLSRLRDRGARSRILTRIDALQLHGYFGVTRSVGKRVFEMKLDFGPGYRIYFARHGEEIVLLLLGGDKSSQARDILEAQRLAAEVEPG